MRRGAILAISIALVISVVPIAIETARADRAAEARFLDELAREAYARGRYADALGLFLEVQSAAPSARTLYNVALCAALTGDDALAYASFAEYLASDDGQASRRADAERRMASLSRRLALVRVESEPPGATIWIDRRELGAYGTTPRTVVLAPGAHTIELERAGHHVARIEVVAALAAVREARATLPARTGRVRIDVARAAEASIALEREGESLPIASGREADVPVGAWRARVSATGMREAVIPLSVREQGLERRSVELEPLPTPTGRLLVRTASIAARVMIDGEPRAETPARLEVPAGEHEIAIEAPGHVRWARRVEVHEDRTLRLDVTLVRE